jgi:hypothetical protein
VPSASTLTELDLHGFPRDEQNAKLLHFKLEFGPNIFMKQQLLQNDQTKDEVAAILFILLNRLRENIESMERHGFENDEQSFTGDLFCMVAIVEGHGRGQEIMSAIQKAELGELYNRAKNWVISAKSLNKSHKDKLNKAISISFEYLILNAPL